MSFFMAGMPGCGMAINVCQVAPSTHWVPSQTNSDIACHLVLKGFLVSCSMWPLCQSPSTPAPLAIQLANVCKLWRLMLRLVLPGYCSGKLLV